MKIHKCKLPKLWRKVAANLTVTVTCSECGQTFILDKKYNTWNALATSCNVFSYLEDIKKIKEM